MDMYDANARQEKRQYSSLGSFARNVVLSGLIVGTAIFGFSLAKVPLELRVGETRLTNKKLIEGIDAFSDKATDYLRRNVFSSSQSTTVNATTVNAVNVIINYGIMNYHCPSCECRQRR